MHKYSKTTHVSTFWYFPNLSNSNLVLVQINIWFYLNWALTGNRFAQEKEKMDDDTLKTTKFQLCASQTILHNTTHKHTHTHTCVEYVRRMHVCIYIYIYIYICGGVPFVSLQKLPPNFPRLDWSQELPKMTRWHGVPVTTRNTETRGAPRCPDDMAYELAKYFGKSQSAILYYGWSRGAILYYGWSQNAILYYGWSQGAILYHGWSQGAILYYGRSQGAILYYGWSQDAILYYGRSQNAILYYGNSQSGTFYHGWSHSAILYYGRSQNDPGWRPYRGGRPAAQIVD